MKELKQGLVLRGDGRADNPGHSAKLFGSYTMIVLDLQLVQVSSEYVVLHH